MDEGVYRRLGEIEKDHWWFRARREIIASVTGNLSLPAEPGILECGCGTGGNLEMLSSFGKVTGFEPEPYALEMARRKNVCPVEAGSLPDDFPFRDEGFDLVLALDVLEHLDNDVRCLEVMRSALKPGAWAIFTVPAFNFLWSRHDETHHHKRRYTRDAFFRILVKAGFTPLKITYFNFFLFPAVVAVRILKKLLRLDNHPDDCLPGKVANAILHRIFGMEKHIINSVYLPFGSSLLAVARK